jgi:hypothetical protein
MKVVCCTASYTGLTEPYKQSLAASVPYLQSAGIEDGLALQFKNPYISSAMSFLTAKAMESGADVMVYIDYDLSWNPPDLLKLIETPGDVVAGTYRFKEDKVEYMGVIHTGEDHRPVCREDGCIRTLWAPSGFLKVTRKAVDRFTEAYPHLKYGTHHVDLFNHGAHNGAWWGQDAAFGRNWNAIGGEMWIAPNLDITHWDGEKSFPGNFYEFLLRQPGGSKYEQVSES